MPWKAPYVGSRGAFSVRTPILMQLRNEAREQYSGPVLDVPVVCHITFYMPIPKATSKKNRLLMLLGNIRPMSGGDLSNLRKFAEDVLHTVVYDDDKVIVGGLSSKWYDDEPRTEIKIIRVCLS